jgi:hypothetical protein
MVTFLPEARPKRDNSFMGRLGRGLNKATGSAIEIGERYLQEQGEKERQQGISEAVQRITGKDVSGLTPAMQMEYLKLFGQGENQSTDYLRRLQTKQVEEEKKKAENAKQTRGIEKQRGLEEGSLRDFEDNPSLANQVSKNDAGKKPLGGLTGQPIPPEVSQKINEIMQSSSGANADELKLQLDQAGVPPAFSNGYIENRRRQDERAAASKDRRLEHGQARAEKVVDQALEVSKELPLLESSIIAMEDAVINGDQSFFSPDNLAEITGIELFRTAKGAQFKTAMKNYFIQDLKTSGARPNQFLEKQLVDALSKIGRSEEANRAVIESFKFANDLKRKRIEMVRGLEKFYSDSTGYLPGNLGSIIEDTMDPYIKERQKEYESQLRFLAEKEKSKKKNPRQRVESDEGFGLSGKFVDVIGPDGKEYEVDQSEVEMLPKGYLLK